MICVLQKGKMIKSIYKIDSWGDLELLIQAQRAGVDALRFILLDQ